MVKVVCINSKNQPKDFKNKDLWPVEKQDYHIERIHFVPASLTLGVQLAEIDLTDNWPYIYFCVTRFAIYDLEAFFNLIRACNEEQKAGFDVDEYIKKILESPKILNPKEEELIEI